MAYLEESRYNHNVPRCRKQEGPRWGAQRQVANAVCVETTLGVERHVFAQRARIYCRAAILIRHKLSRRRCKTHQFPCTEHGAAPRRGLGGPTVEALAANSVTEFHPRIVRVDRPVAPEPRKGLVKHAASGIGVLRWRERKAKRIS